MRFGKGDVLFLLLIFLILPTSSSIESSNYKIYNPTVSDGASTGLESSNYALELLVGEISGTINSATQTLKLGFWYTFVPEVIPETTSSSSTSGGGGGSSLKEYDIMTEKTDLVISVVIDEKTKREIKIISNENKSLKISARVEGEVKDKITILNSFEIFPGENTISLDVFSSERGIFTGEIIFEVGKTLLKLPVIINTRTDNFLFDASISMSDEFKKVHKGDRIIAQISLLEVLSGTKVDILINYIIKDFSGNVYLEESETFFVERERKHFLRSSQLQSFLQEIMFLELS